MLGTLHSEAPTAEDVHKCCKAFYVTLNKSSCHLNVQLGVRIHVVEQLLIIDVLLIPLQRLVVAEVVSQGDEEDLAAVQFGLFTVLIQEQLGPA